MWQLLRLGCLVCHCMDLLLNGCGIAEVIMTNGMDVLVQFVNKGDSSGNVHIYDVGVRYSVEIFDHRPQAVPVTRNQDVLPGSHSRCDAIVPTWEGSCLGILQAFRCGQLVRAEMLVARIVARMPWILLFESGRTDIVTPAPQLDLCLAILSSRLGLV